MRIALLYATLLVMGNAAAAGKDTVTVRNKSAWEIQELYLSTVDANAWGADRLGLDTLESGKNVKLADIPCGSYDVRVVNADGDECVVAGAVLCADHDAWTLTDADLQACELPED